MQVVITRGFVEAGAAASNIGDILDVPPALAREWESIGRCRPWPITNPLETPSARPVKLETPTSLPTPKRAKR